MVVTGAIPTAGPFLAVHCGLIIYTFPVKCDIQRLARLQSATQGHASLRRTAQNTHEDRFAWSYTHYGDDETGSTGALSNLFRKGLVAGM